MLIPCPECQKQISDKSEMCIYCGYPLKKINICNINGIEYDFSVILSDINNSQKTPASFVRQISDMCNIPIYEARNIYFSIKNDGILPQNIKCEKKGTINIPKCPTCGSPNIRKISTSRKIAGAIGFGLLSKTAKSQFECLNCKYKW